MSSGKCLTGAFDIQVYQVQVGQDGAIMLEPS